MQFFGTDRKGTSICKGFRRNPCNCWCHQVEGNYNQALFRTILTQQSLCTSGAWKLIRALQWVLCCQRSTGQCLLHNRKSYIQVLISIFLGLFKTDNRNKRNLKGQLHFFTTAKHKSEVPVTWELSVFIFNLLCFKKYETNPKNLPCLTY